MDLSRAAIYGLFVMMCVNSSAAMLATIDINTAPLPAWNETQIQGALNSTEIVESWAGADSAFYDIGAGLNSWWYRNIPLIEAFPAQLQAYGVPAFIYNPIHDIWRLLWVTFVSLVVIAGRNV